MRFVTALLRGRALAGLVAMAMGVGVLAHQNVAVGALSGRVVNDAGQGLSGATVKISLVGLIGGPAKIDRTMATDDDGRFDFHDVPAGRVAVVASLAGYLSTEFGAAGPDAAGVPVRISAAERVSNVVIVLRKSGAMSGRVTCEKGEPCAARIRAVPAGKKTPGVFSEAGDDGVYRIADLPDGPYVLVAEAKAAEFQIKDTSGADRIAVPVRTFYPAAASEADALPVTIAPGEETTGLDIRVTLLPATSVEVSATTATGVRAQQVQLALLTADGTRAGVQAYTSGTELPRIEGVIAGQYQLVVSGVERPQGIRETTWATGLVNVDATRPVRVSVVLGTGARIEGRMRLDPLAAPDRPEVLIRQFWVAFATRTGGTRIGVQRENDQDVRPPPMDKTVPVWMTPIGPTVPPGLLAVDGRLEIYNADPARFGLTEIAPGRYVIEAGDLNGPPGWSLKSATIGGRDVLDLPIALRAGDNLTAVELMLSNRYASLTGSVTDESGKGRFDLTVLVFPADSRYWWKGARRIQTVRPDTSGVYELRDLPAGEYVLVTVPPGAAIDGSDAELLGRLALTATHVTIGDGEQKVQDLRTPMLTSRVHANYRR